MSHLHLRAGASVARLREAIPCHKRRLLRTPALVRLKPHGAREVRSQRHTNDAAGVAAGVAVPCASLRGLPLCGVRDPRRRRSCARILGGRDCQVFWTRFSEESYDMAKKWGLEKEMRRDILRPVGLDDSEFGNTFSTLMDWNCFIKDK